MGIKDLPAGSKTGIPKRYPVYLVVADNTNEFDIALRYAARSALQNEARLAILYVIPEAEHIFMPWKQVNDRIDEEARLYAESYLQGIGQKLKAYGLTPSLYFRSGGVIEEVRELANSDRSITKLILAGDTGTGSPGPLVSHFTGRGLKELNVPVTIVPSHIDDSMFEELFEQID